MKVLKAIGRFFAAIGRWIRDTAWVQPLLIVGGIFGLIFSIPYIVQGVSSWFDGGNSADKYYEKFKLSLNDSENNNSEADGLMKYIEDREEGKHTTEQVDKYGEKFFLTFVGSDCKGCEEAHPGFETLQQKWNNEGDGYKINDGKKFKLYTIFVDEETDDDLIANQTSFKDYFYDRHSDFFEQAPTLAENRPFFYNNGGSGGGYAGLLPSIGDVEDFQTPTSFLIDWSFEEHETYGVTEVFFNYDGSNKETHSYALANTLRDCWNHEGIFADDYKA